MWLLRMRHNNAQLCIDRNDARIQRLREHANYIEKQMISSIFLDRFKDVDKYLTEQHPGKVL